MERPGKAPEGAKEVEEFFGVYLLYSLNPRFKGRTYIGFTVDPNRRILQHNSGTQAGGARRTSGKGPWEMVLITHGFPNEISALRFERSWQHPRQSRRLKHLPAKKSTEKSYDYCLRILASMLNLGPWSRLPLTVRWLNPDYEREFSLSPPLHMPIVYGPVKSIKQKKNKEEGKDENQELSEDLLCNICFKTVARTEMVECLNPKCRTTSHMICLSQSFLGSEDRLLPIQGKCSTCDCVLLWGDLVRKKKGCYEAVHDDEFLEDSDS